MGEWSDTQIGVWDGMRSPLSTVEESEMEMLTQDQGFSMFSVSPLLSQCVLTSAPLPSAKRVIFLWIQFLNLKIQRICKQSSHVALPPSFLVNSPVPRLQVCVEEQIFVVHWKILRPLESYFFLPLNVNVPWEKHSGTPHMQGMAL